MNRNNGKSTPRERGTGDHVPHMGTKSSSFRMKSKGSGHLRTVIRTAGGHKKFISQTEARRHTTEKRTVASFKKMLRKEGVVAKPRPGLKKKAFDYQTSVFNISGNDEDDARANAGESGDDDDDDGGNDKGSKSSSAQARASGRAGRIEDSDDDDELEESDSESNSQSKGQRSSARSDNGGKKKPQAATVKPNSKATTKPVPFQAEQRKFEEEKQKRMEERVQREQARQEHQARVREQQRKRQETTKLHKLRTKKGQPVLSATMDGLLSKIMRAKQAQ